MPDIDPGKILKRLAFEADDARVKATPNSLIAVEIILLGKAPGHPDGYAADLSRARLAEQEEKIPSTLNDSGAGRCWASTCLRRGRKRLTCLPEASC